MFQRNILWVERYHPLITFAMLNRLFPFIELHNACLQHAGGACNFATHKMFLRNNKNTHTIEIRMAMFQRNILWVAHHHPLVACCRHAL